MGGRGGVRSAENYTLKITGRNSTKPKVSTHEGTRGTSDVMWQRAVNMLIRAVDWFGRLKDTSEALPWLWLAFWFVFGPGVIVWGSYEVGLPIPGKVFFFVVLVLMWTGAGYFWMHTRGKLTPSIKVDIRSRWLDQEWTEQAKRDVERVAKMGFHGATPSRRYHSKIHILNSSTQRRISLNLASYGVEMKNGAPGWQQMGGIKSDGLRLNLGPEEDTEGTITVDIPQPWAEGEHRLLIVDRLSGRKAVVKVPGRFPAQ